MSFFVYTLFCLWLWTHASFWADNPEILTWSRGGAA